MAREVRSDRARLTPADYVPDWIRRGGPGSGHFGHEGRPGQRGGSAPGDGETSISEGKSRGTVKDAVSKVMAAKFNESSPFALKATGSASFFIAPNGKIYAAVGSMAHHNLIEAALPDMMRSIRKEDKEGIDPDWSPLAQWKELASVRGGVVRGIFVTPEHAQNAENKGYLTFDFDLTNGPSSEQQETINDMLALYGDEEYDYSFDLSRNGERVGSGHDIRDFYRQSGIVQRGGPGSGHFGHEGRPGQRGGSAPGDGETSISEANASPTPAKEKWSDRLREGEARVGEIDLQRAADGYGWWLSPSGKFYEVGTTHDDVADDLFGGRGYADQAVKELGVRPSSGAATYSGDVLLQAFGWARGGQRERRGPPLMFVDLYHYPTQDQEDAVKALYLIVKPSEFEVQDSSGTGKSSRGVRGEAERIFGEMPDLAAVARGGPGSGHFGHEGRPGQRGGSAPGEGETSISESRPRVRPSDTPPTTDEKVYERIKSAMYQPDSKNYGPRSADQVAKGLQEQGGAWHLWLLPNGEAIRVESHMDADWAVRWDMKKAVFEDGFERTPTVEAIITSKNDRTNTEAMYRAGAVRISAFARNPGADVTIGITVGGKEFLQPTDKQAEYVSDLYYRTPAAEWIMELAVGEIAGHAMWLDDFEKNAARAGLRLRAAPAPAFFYIPLLNEDGIAVLAADIGRYLMRYSIEGTAVPQTDLHVTLLYLDAITDGQMKQMLDGLALPLRFKVEVVGMERLGDALVLRLAPDPALLRLQRDLWMAAKRVGAQIGVFSNPSEFKPHITLAYDIPPLLRLDDLPITQDNLNHCETWTVSCDTFAFGRENGEAKRTVALPKTAGDRLFVVQGGPMVWPHISKPQGRIELTHEQWLAVMRGKTVLTAGRRLVTRSMGPFVVKGGPGSGHFGHEGRPGQRGGSAPSEGGTSISEGKEAQAVAINSGVLNATWKGNLESTPDDSLAVADDFNDRGWLIHDEEIKAGAEFWLSPEGHAFGVEQVGGHAEAAGRALFNLYGLKLAEAMKEDAITREVDEGYNSVDRPAWRYSWQGEGGAQTDLGSLIQESRGFYRWEPGVGLVLAETHNLSDAILDSAAQEAMRRTTFDSEAKAVSAIEAVAPYAAVWGMMRANASATSNTETKLAALGFVRVSRGGTGAQNTAGISWDASLPPTKAQRDVLSTVVAQAQADPKHNGGIVWETVNQTMATAGIEGVATETDDYESFWSAIEGNYAKAMHARSVSEDLVRRFLIQRGGPGSGHFGHEGRQGQRGGSLPGEGGTSISEGRRQGGTAGRSPNLHSAVDALKVPRTEKWIPVSDALAAIDSVHGIDGVPLNLKVLALPATSGAGHLRVERGPGHFQIKNMSLRVLREGETAEGIPQHLELTVAHEFGHTLDWTAFQGIQKSSGDWGDYDKPMQGSRAVWYLGADNDVYGVMKAIKESEACTALKVESMPNKAWPGGTEKLVYDSETMRYLREPEELFARAYAQYIAVRSGNEPMLNAVDDLQNAAKHGHPPLAWDDKDFQSIAGAFDRMFGERGWR